MTAPRPRGTLRWFLRLPLFLYRWNCGALLGNRFLLLIHVGRRTGRRHETVLEVLEYRKEGPEAVVMCGFGPTADWLRNIRAASDPVVVIGSRRFVAGYRVLDVDEAVNVMNGYERRNRFMTPVLRAVLSRLLGWHYSGSAADRRRLAGQLPLVAFRPRR